MIYMAVAACAGELAAAPEPDEATAEVAARDAHSTKEDLAVPRCLAKFNDSLGSDGIAAPGEARPPKVAHSVEAILSNEARSAKGRINNLAVMTLVVDTNGNPQNVCLLKSAGYGLDANAEKAVRQYKFDPATKDGKPVPTRITIEVDYKLYAPKP